MTDIKPFCERQLCRLPPDLNNSHAVAVSKTGNLRESLFFVKRKSPNAKATKSLSWKLTIFQKFCFYSICFAGGVALNVYEDIVVYSCNDGFEFNKTNPVNQITCTADGLWEPKKLDTCIPVSCGPPSLSQHIRLTGFDFTYNKIVLYGCDKGYDLVGPSKRVCLSTK